jgi:hypothetical protein
VIVIVALVIVVVIVIVFGRFFGHTTLRLERAAALDATAPGIGGTRARTDTTGLRVAVCAGPRAARGYSATRSP